MTIEEYWALHTEREDHWTPETCVQCLHCAEIGDRRLLEGRNV